MEKDFRSPEPLSEEARVILTGGRDKMMTDATSKPEPEDADLREQIAKEYGEDRYRDNFYGPYVTEQDREACRKWVDVHILPLLEAAGWHHCPKEE